MLKDNLRMLRSIHGFSQEEIAEKINISRQAYAKWETGATVPDVEKCAQLARIYGTTVDDLLETKTAEGIGVLPPAPKGKFIFGTVTLGDRGQIVIPKEVRDHYNFTGGTRLIVLGDENGIALLPLADLEKRIRKVMDMASSPEE